MEESPIQKFASDINYLAIKHSFSVTSWFRTSKRNEQVGGVRGSFHLFGLAVDCVLDNILDRSEFVKDARSIGLVVVPEIDHIHLQFSPEKITIEGR